MQSQELSLSATTASLTDNLVDGRMTGGALSIAFPSPSGVWTYRLGFERAQRTRDAFGTPCFQDFFPSECDPEPLRDRARLQTAMIGVGARVINSGRVHVILTMDGGVGQVSSDIRGQTSNISLAASIARPAGEVGVELRYRPAPRVPLSIRARGAFGVVLGSSDNVVDGYSPFDESITLSRMSLGVSWDFARTR